MSVRTVILKKIADSVSDVPDINIFNIASCLRLKPHKANGVHSYLLPLKTAQYDIQNQVRNILTHDPSNIFDVSVEKDVVSFNLSREKHVKNVLEHNRSEISAPSFVSRENVIVEFSSPNIAKPFHMGHLRSTIVGNYIANVNSFVGNNVKRINYLGDWGTQYGLVQVGVEMENIREDELKSNPMRSLYAAYVAANRLAEADSSVLERAREIFKDLETGAGVTFEQWKLFKRYTVEELKRAYGRIGITFDEYHWESMYNARNIEKVVALMEKMQLLVTDELNRKVVNLGDGKSVPVIKSDGSTLYIARDVAAAIDRFERYSFDRMYYVVDNAQADHFSSLLEILRRMEVPWVERLKHVRFGRLNGLRTRRGNVTFLEEILDTARDIMKQKQMDSSTTKVHLDSTDNSSDVLGISAMIVNDLKRRRQRDYTFDWDAALDLKGDTGVRLQYAHCRLVNLERNCGTVLVPECEPGLLREDVVDDLVTLISQFEEVVLRSHEEMESCILTAYLFNLTRAINRAFKTLRVKDEAPDVASQRLLLFHVSRNVLARGMKLLGLMPLEEM